MLAALAMSMQTTRREPQQIPNVSAHWRPARLRDCLEASRRIGRGSLDPECPPSRVSDVVVQGVGDHRRGSDALGRCFLRGLRRRGNKPCPKSEGSAQLRRFPRVHRVRSSTSHDLPFPRRPAEERVGHRRFPDVLRLLCSRYRRAPVVLEDADGAHGRRRVDTAARSSRRRTGGAVPGVAPGVHYCVGALATRSVVLGCDLHPLAHLLPDTGIVSHARREHRYVPPSAFVEILGGPYEPLALGGHDQIDARGVVADSEPLSPGGDVRAWRCTC